MTTYDKIAVTGMAKAEQLGLNNLIEKIQIPFYEEITEDFIMRMINDLSEFQTLEQYLNAEKLFSKAALYSYAKGAEFALSHRLKSPMDKIGYNFDSCMTTEFSNTIPKTILTQITFQNEKILEIYYEMYKVIRVSQETLIQEGISFNDCLFRILSGLFFFGKKVGLSLDLNENTVIDFSFNETDEKYDYDNYDGKYNESDIFS